MDNTPQKSSTWVVFAVFFAVIIILGGFYLLLRTVKSHFEPSPSAQITKIAVPSTAPSNSLAIFELKPLGDPEAKLYANSFARALGDRLYCSPDCITLQPRVNSLLSEVNFRLRNNPKADVFSEKPVKEMGKALGVRYTVSGELKTVGDKVEITLYLNDLSSKRSHQIFTESGMMADMRKMQTAFVNDIVKAMELQPTLEQVKMLSDSNFSKPETLALYGKSRAAETISEVSKYRWQAVQSDPDSLFANIRLLELYAYAGIPKKELMSNKQLDSLVAKLLAKYPNHSHINSLAGSIEYQRYHYVLAEDILRNVIRDDPKMAWAYNDLAYVAVDRLDGNLAISKAQKAVSMWPNCASFRLILAKAYDTAADNARHGHYFGDMNNGIESKWQKNSTAAFDEAYIATELDPNCYEAWSVIRSTSLGLGRNQDRDKAFQEQVRICPKDRSAYTDYAFCFAPQWGSDPGKQSEIFALAEKNLTPADACVAKAFALLSGQEPDSTRLEILDLTNKAIAASKSPDYQAMNVKCRVLLGLKRHEDFLEVAKQGFELWPSPQWRLLLAQGYQFHYQDTRDWKSLSKAKDLLSVYVDEIPYSAYGHVQLGWCLSHQGEREAAKKHFLRALELDPTNELAKEKLKYVQ